MSHLSADSLMPLVTALPVSELYALQVKLNRLLRNQDKPVKKKKDIYTKIGEKYRPENFEQLVSEIMHEAP